MDVRPRSHERADLAQPLYHTDRVYRFQAKGVALGYLRQDNLVVWSTGLGKSHFAMALAALLVEDDLIDHVLVICEGNKITEWVGDFRRFTRLPRVAAYLGPSRKKHLVDLPDVLVTTYETSRNDASLKIEGRPRAREDGPLLVALRGRRVLVVYDEASRLKNRDSGIYRSHEHLLNRLRKVGTVRTVALTATPVESSPENIFNIGRIISPGILTVADFNRFHVRGRDPWGNATGYCHIGDNDRSWGSDVPTLFERLAPILQVKDKFDADVVDEFPSQVEEFEFVTYDSLSKKILDELEAKDESTGGAGWMTLRQFACHPAALLASKADLALWAAATYGPEVLRGLKAPKLEALLHHLELLVREERRKVVVFTFFGQSVLPILRSALIDKGYRVAVNHGQMSPADREAQKDLFRTGPAEVFLTSDAGSRGINLPEATAVINYEMPLLHATYEQRINRIHRIDSAASSVLALTLLAKDTVEEDIAALALERNAWFDSFTSSALAAGTKLRRPSAELRQRLLSAANITPTTEEDHG